MVRSFRGTEPETRKLQQICCRLVALRPISRYVFFGVDDNKSAACCALSGLVQVDCQKFVSTSLMQVVSITYSKSANIRLHQV